MKKDERESKILKKCKINDIGMKMGQMAKKLSNIMVKKLIKELNLIFKDFNRFLIIRLNKQSIFLLIH
mgnify:FL=1